MWRKSSYSAYNGNCVEVDMDWRKSSYSSYNGNCVETATGCGQVHVRDSKDPGGPVLSFGPQEWAEFTAAAKAGKYAIA